MFRITTTTATGRRAARKNDTIAAIVEAFDSTRPANRRRMYYRLDVLAAAMTGRRANLSDVDDALQEGYLWAAANMTAEKYAHDARHLVNAAYIAGARAALAFHRRGNGRMTRRVNGAVVASPVIVSSIDSSEFVSPASREDFTRAADLRAVIDGLGTGRAWVTFWGRVCDGWTVRAAADAAGVAEKTGQRWLAQVRAALA